MIARKIGVPVTPHATVMERAASAAERLDQAMRTAQAAGLVRFFNREFRRWRLDAATAGRGFVSYPAARKRLAAAIAGALATGGELQASLVAQAFGAATSKVRHREVV